jgi:tetratricopeptide (TPR) repeat protein
MLWPRWGGTEQLIAETSERAAQDAGFNPRLATLRGAVHENRANDSSLADNEAGAVREMNKALAFGPERTYLLRRGESYFRLGAYEYAFHDLRTVVLEQSQNARALEYYGRTLIELARRARPAIRPTILERAIESLTLAAYLTPGETRVSTALAAARQMAGR